MLSRAPISPLAGWHLEPAPGVRKRDLLSLQALGIIELHSLLDLAVEVKQSPLDFSRVLGDRAGALTFEKPAQRTRVTFEVGLRQLGAQPIYLAPRDFDFSKRETAPIIPHHLERWVDVLIVRPFGEATLRDLALAAEIPVINALSDLFHPCQVVADLLTLRERKGRLAGLAVAFIGGGDSNVAHSLVHGAAKTGVHLTLATPPGYEPSPAILEEASADARSTGASIRIVHDPDQAARGADAIYADVWARSGPEERAEQRRRDFASYRVDSHLMSIAGPDAVFLHGLLPHRGEEVTDEVLHGPQSIALDQAANRLPAHKAILLALLGGRPFPFAMEGRL